MDRIERIRIMEEKFTAAAAAVRELERALDAYLDAQEDLCALEDYLAGDERRGDLAADEAGLLPAELRRGVLSEDGVYDLLTENDALRARLRELGV